MIYNEVKTGWKMRSIIPFCLALIFLALPALSAAAATVTNNYPPPGSCNGAEEMLARDPKNLDLLIDLGACAALNSHPNPARVVGKLDAALKANPGDTRLRVLAAMIHAAEARFEAGPAAKKSFGQAEKRFQEAAERSPEQGYVWHERAIATHRWAVKFSGPEKAALRAQACQYSLEALKRAPLDSENWNTLMLGSLMLLNELQPADRPERARQIVREVEETLTAFFDGPVPAPAGFAVNSAFLSEKGRSAPGPNKYQTLPVDRQRGLLCLYQGTMLDMFAAKTDDRQLREELAKKAFAWFARALPLDPANQAAWDSMEGHLREHSRHEEAYKKAAPDIVSAVRAKLADPDWPGAAEPDQQYLRAMVIYKTAQLMLSMDRRLTLAEEQDGYELLREAVALSPQDLRNVSFWFDWGVGLYWQRELPRAQKKAMVEEMKTVLEAALAVNLADLAKVADLAGMKKDPPEAVREMLTEKWNDYYRQLGQLK